MVEKRSNWAQTKTLNLQTGKTLRKPGKDLTEQAVASVQNGAINGRLSHYGVIAEEPHLDQIDEKQKIVLSKTVQDCAEFNYIMKQGMTSFSEYKYFSPFWDSAKRFQQAHRVVNGFAEIAQIEKLPNLRALYGEINQPMGRVGQIRQTRNALAFRNWLSKTAGEAPDKELTKAYIDEIQNRKGLMEHTSAKMLMSITLATFGVAIGAASTSEMSPLLEKTTAALGGTIGFAGSNILTSVVEKIPDWAADVGVELFDSFFLEKITKGWVPRMFINELSRL